MRCLFTVTLILLLISALPAQQVINNILLPDSLGGMPVRLYCCVYNETNNCIYAGGQDLVIVIDGVTNQKIARIPVTGRVTSMLWVPGENKIFCAQYYNASVTVIDGINNSIITTIQVGIYPVCLKYNSTDNLVYCANRHSRDITVIDAASNSAIALLMFLDEPIDMVWNATDNVLWSVGGSTYAAFPGSQASTNRWYTAIAWNATDNKIYMSDAFYNQVEIRSQNNYTTASVGYWPSALVWNATNDKIYCANLNSDSVSVIDGVTDTVITTIPVGLRPTGLCWNSLENKVYCLNDGDDYISDFDDITVIDGVTDTVITTIQVMEVYQFDYNSPVKPHLAINSQNNQLYFPQQNRLAVRIIDGSNNTVIEDVLLGANPHALVWNTTSNKLYSINQTVPFLQYDEGTISIIDGISQKPISTLTLGIRPIDLVWNSTNNTIFCTNYGTNDVRVIDGISDQIIDTIAVGRGPSDILWNSISNRIYNINNIDKTISIIDGATHSILTTISGLNSPKELTWNRLNNKIYCADRYSGNIMVIDGYTNSVIAQIPIGLEVKGIMWNPASNKIYCTKYTKRISIIDAVMDTIITEIVVMDEPQGLASNLTDNKVYCSGYNSSSRYSYINVINGESNQIINTIQLGEDKHIRDLFWNSLDNRLYVYAIDVYTSQNYFGKLTIIDGVSDSIITTLSLSEFDNFPPYFPGCFAADISSNLIYFADFNKARISVIDPTATGIIPGPLTKVAERFLLQQNYPNPFNPETVISFQLSAVSPVSLKVYDIAGREVAELVNGTRTAGEHIIKWNASNQASGVYFYQLRAGSYVETKKMILMR
jgi:YVTN family beta-propeller protein